MSSGGSAMLLQPGTQCLYLLVGIFGGGITAGFDIVQHLLDKIGAGKEDILQLFRHFRTAVSYQLEHVLHGMTEAFHVSKTHGCGGTFERMDRPEDLVNGVLVGTVFQVPEGFLQDFHGFPGIQRQTMTGTAQTQTCASSTIFATSRSTASGILASGSTESTAFFWMADRAMP